MRKLLYTLVFVATISPVHCEIKVVCYDSTGPCNRHEKLQCSEGSTISIKEVHGWFHQTGCTSCKTPTNTTCCNYKSSDVHLGERQSDKRIISEQCSSQSKCFPFDGLVTRNDSAGKQIYIAVDFICEGSSNGNPVNSIVIVIPLILLIVAVILVLIIVYCAKRNRDIKKNSKEPDEEHVNKQPNYTFAGNSNPPVNHDAKRNKDTIKTFQTAHNDTNIKSIHTQSKLKGSFDKSDELMDDDFDHVTYSNGVVPGNSRLANEPPNKIAVPRHISESNKSLQLVSTLSCMGIEVSEHSKNRGKLMSDKQSRKAPARRSRSMENSGKRKTEISRRFTRGQTDSRFTEEQKFRKPTIKENTGVAKTPNKLRRDYLKAEPELLDDDFDNIQYTKSPSSELKVSDKRSEYYKASPLKSSSIGRSSQLVTTLGCLGIEVSERSKKGRGRISTSFNNHKVQEERDTNSSLIKATGELPRALTSTAAAYEELYKQINNSTSITKDHKLHQETNGTGSPGHQLYDSMEQVPPSDPNQRHKLDNSFINDVDKSVIADTDTECMDNHHANSNVRRSSSVPASYYYSHKYDRSPDKTKTELHSKLELKYKADYVENDNFEETYLSVTDRKTKRKRKRSRSRQKQSPRQEPDTDRVSLSNKTTDHSESKNDFSNNEVNNPTFMSTESVPHAEYLEYSHALKEKINTDGQTQGQSPVLDFSTQDNEMSYHYEIQDDDETDYTSNKNEPKHSGQNNTNQDAVLKSDRGVDYIPIKTAVVRPLIQEKSRYPKNKYRSFSFSDTGTCNKTRAHEIKYNRNKPVFPYDTRVSQFPGQINGYSHMHHLHSKHRNTGHNTVALANFLTAKCSAEMPSSLSLSLMPHKMPNSSKSPEGQDGDSHKNIAVPFSREMTTENSDKHPYGLEIPSSKEQDDECIKNDTDLASLEGDTLVQSGYPGRSSSFLVQPTVTKTKQVHRSKSDRNSRSSDNQLKHSS